MGIQHCYIESVAVWNREWAGDESDNDQMSEEERDEAEDSARVEIERAFDEEAWHREQERGQRNLPCLSEIELDLDAAF